MDARLILGDAIEAMRDLPPNSVDAVICDPPYGTTRNSWDSIIPLDAMWSEIRRILKPGGAVVFTASQPFSSLLVASNLGWFRHEWIWQKNKATGHLNAKRAPMRAHETVLVFSGEPPRYFPQGLIPFNRVTKRGHNGSNFGKSGTENFQEFTNYPLSVIRFDSESKTVHPTQKPVALMEYLVRTYTTDGDTVLDFAMGSGTTGEACEISGRNFIGIDNDRARVDGSAERLRKAGAIVSIEACEARLS